MLVCGLSFQRNGCNSSQRLRLFRETYFYIDMEIRIIHSERDRDVHLIVYTQHDHHSVFQNARGLLASRSIEPRLPVIVSHWSTLSQKFGPLQALVQLHWLTAPSCAWKGKEIQVQGNTGLAPSTLFSAISLGCLPSFWFRGRSWFAFLDVAMFCIFM